MNVWNNLPFVRFLVAFVIGILTAIHFPAYSDLSWYVLLFLALAFIVFQQLFKSNYQFKFLKGIPIVLFFVCFGIKLVHLQTESTFENHFSKIKHDYFLIKIAEPPKNKTNTLKIIGHVTQVKQQNKWIKTKGKILIYVSKDQQAINLKYGDFILCNSKIIPTPAPKNPSEFNYKKYLAFHQIFHQTYLNKQHWVYTGIKDANWLLANSYRLRNYLLHLISSANITGDEYAIGSALILGYEDDLSNVVISSFAATGALHVLSVSGLHVGIVFLVINFFLQYLGESKPARITRFVMSLAGLWLYALITGLSPSVWRAAAMFSLITMGKFYKKDISTINIVGCSAFILLCINPYMITEVGFQLSYLAVIGIVILHPKFYELLTIKNKILDQVWTISCVSVAAQLITFPLGLLYFHQFPNYFLFSNLLIIPLSTIILYGGILLLAVAKIPIAGALVAKVLYGLLWLLKSTVAVFENLPYAIMDGIAISTLETFLVYGILIGLFCFWMYKKLIYVQLSLMITIFFCTLQIAEKLEQKSQEKIVIYSINKHAAIDFIAGTKHVLMADSSLLKNNDKMRFHMLPNWNNLGLAKAQTFNFNDSISIKSNTISSQNNYIFYKNKTILHTAKEIVALNTLKYKPEIVLLNMANKIKFKQLFKLFPEAKFICDGTISPYLYQSLKKKHPHINISSVLSEGAITIEVG